MNVSVAGQTVEFFNSALLGVGLGVTYDLFRLLRVYVNAGKVITAVLDVVYWICAIIALITFILTVSAGNMRWYVLVGAFCGGFVYMCTVSRLFFRTFDIIIKIVIRLLRLIVKPMYFIARKGLEFARRADKGIKAGAKRCRVRLRGKETPQSE